MQRKHKHSDVEKGIAQPTDNTWSSWFYSLPTWEKVIIVGIAAGATVATLGGISLLFMPGNNTINPNRNPPLANSDFNSIPFSPAEECRGLITTSPYDNSEIKDISLYGSGAGHPFGREQDCFDFNQGGTRVNPDPSCCGSYKHYIRFENNSNKHNIRSLGKVKITKITSEYGGIQLDLVSMVSPNIHFRIFHVDLREGLQEGSVLSPGQLIGTANPKSWSDVAVEYFSPNGEYGHLSMFECMDDNTLRSFGFSSREEALEKMTYKGEYPNCTNAHQSMRTEDSSKDFVSCCDILAKAAAENERNSLWNSFSSFFSSKSESVDKEEKEELKNARTPTIF